MRLYNSDNWFYKQGLVGFDRIIQYNKNFMNLDINEYGYIISDEYIEFEVELLENFHKYYFEYFLGRYNSLDRQTKKLIFHLNACKYSIDVTRFNDNVKSIKDIVKKNNDKIKGLDIKIYDEGQFIYKCLGDIKKIEQLNDVENLVNRYTDLLRKDVVNLKLSLNLVRSVLYNNYFGQVSFLQKNCANKTLQEQEDILFKDFILPIIELNRLKEIIEFNDEEKLINYINSITTKEKKNEVNVLISQFKKDLFGKKRKEKSIEKVLEKYDICNLCEEEISLGSDYGEGNFIPLALSNSNSKNMFWEFNVRYPICPICKLIFLCTAAGSTDIFKSYLGDKYKYNDKTFYGFIGIEGGLQELIKQNNNFANRNDNNSSFSSYILDSILENSQISRWQLENILYVEFNADYSAKKSKINYFNIPMYLAKFLKNNYELMCSITDKKIRMEVFDLILSGKDLKSLIDKKLRENLKRDNTGDINILSLIKIRRVLNLYKGECDMDNGKLNNKINFLYMKGSEIGKILKNRGQENKIQSISYRLLNSTKSRNKQEFMDTIIRIFMSVDIEIPMILLDVLKEELLDFEDVAHSFISGLINKESYKKGNLEEENKNGQVNNF